MATPNTIMAMPPTRSKMFAISAVTMAEDGKLASPKPARTQAK